MESFAVTHHKIIYSVIGQIGKKRMMSLFITAKFGGNTEVIVSIFQNLDGLRAITHSHSRFAAKIPNFGIKCWEIDKKTKNWFEHVKNWNETQNFDKIAT